MAFKRTATACIAACVMAYAGGAYAADRSPMDEVRAMMVAFMKEVELMRLFLGEKNRVEGNKSTWEAAEQAYAAMVDKKGAGPADAEEIRVRDAYYATNNTYYESEGLFRDVFKIDLETTAEELRGNPEYARQMAEEGVQLIGDFMAGRGRGIEDLWISLNDRLSALEQNQKDGKISRRDFLQLIAIRSQMGTIRSMVPGMIGEMLPNGLDLQRILAGRLQEEATKAATRALQVAQDRQSLAQQFRPGQSFGLRPSGPDMSVNPLSPGLAGPVVPIMQFPFVRTAPAQSPLLATSPGQYMTPVAVPQPKAIPAPFIASKTAQDMLRLPPAAPRPFVQPGIIRPVR